MMESKIETVKPFNPHLIRTKIIKQTKWSAFVTWKCVDLQEYGETERNAVLFLFKRHHKFLGVIDFKAAMRTIGFY